eukprot:TRINITY_DN28715_c0_g1_i1.p1 TRINITY_DN28715_c0_g1~~TRINITY_DN28715_c0_g1_i1.p1  ORF type:complete len:276 (+),score=18.57 TRINITY_DN28715_c0_g1_i1:103-828(+)
MICSCGTRAPKTAKFCQECGSKLLSPHSQPHVVITVADQDDSPAAALLAKPLSESRRSPRKSPHRGTTSGSAAAVVASPAPVAAQAACAVVANPVAEQRLHHVSQRDAISAASSTAGPDRAATSAASPAASRRLRLFGHEIAPPSPRAGVVDVTATVVSSARVEAAAATNGPRRKRPRLSRETASLKSGGSGAAQWWSKSETRKRKTVTPLAAKRASTMPPTFVSDGTNDRERQRAARNDR